MIPISKPKGFTYFERATISDFEFSKLGHRHKMFAVEACNITETFKPLAKRLFCIWSPGECAYM